MLISKSQLVPAPTSQSRCPETLNSPPKPSLARLTLDIIDLSILHPQQLVDLTVAAFDRCYAEQPIKPHLVACVFRSAMLRDPLTAQIADVILRSPFPAPSFI